MWHCRYIHKDIASPMSNRASILSTVLANPIQQAGEVSRLLPRRPALEAVEEPSRQRTRIWDLHHSLYCSIIGTCLTTAELRAILLRLDVHGAQSADITASISSGSSWSAAPRPAPSICRRRSIAGTR